MLPQRLLLVLAAASLLLAACTNNTTLPLGCGDASCACLSDKDCSVPTPFCNVATGACAVCPVGQIVCKGSAQCVPAATICGATCSANSDCKPDPTMPAQACCGGMCVSLVNDSNNCGACGSVCSAAANSTSHCNAGVCGNGACNVGFADCDGIAANGCETPVASDPQNCGTCGHKCQGGNAVYECKANLCTVTGCASGFADCNAMPADGCEAAISSDAQNCGGCNMPCAAAPHSVASCANAVCQQSGCAAGFGDCNNNSGDGCEADLTQPGNCGSCGHNCPVPPNAAAACMGGMCGQGACNAGFADCDHNPVNGCELPVSADLKNCGMCGAVCSPANAVAACVAGQCTVAMCNAGYVDCDKSAANGCEIQTGIDPKNCGACGNVCPMQTPNCSLGACTNLYSPVGAQTNVPIAQLAGWTQCYQDSYASKGTTVISILAGCSKAKLMLACRPTGAATLALLAWAPRADVIFDTGMGNTPHNANGVGWYFSDNWSWGFAPQGDVITRNNCDESATPDNNLRLCWHTVNLQPVGTLEPGYRCGPPIVNYGTYDRIIYQAD